MNVYLINQNKSLIKLPSNRKNQFNNVIRSKVPPTNHPKIKNSKPLQKQLSTPQNKIYPLYLQFHPPPPFIGYLAHQREKFSNYAQARRTVCAIALVFPRNEPILITPYPSFSLTIWHSPPPLPRPRAPRHFPAR